MKFTDPKKLQAHLDKRATTLAKKNVKKVVTRGIMLINSTAKQSIQAGGSGQSVKRYNPIREHVTSSPNKPPATDTGFLVSQITTNISSKPDGSVVGQLISSAPYSKALEYGTVNMQPRPFMHPAFQKNKNKILKMFKEQGIIK